MGFDLMAVVSEDDGGMVVWYMRTGSRCDETGGDETSCCAEIGEPGKKNESS